MDYKVMLDAIKKRKAKSFNSRGMLDEMSNEEGPQKPELLAKDTVTLGGQRPELPEVDKEDELLPNREPAEEEARPKKKNSAQKEASNELGLDPFSRARRKVDEELGEEEEDGPSSDVEEDVYDASVFDRIKKGKKPSGLYERMQANLGRKRNKKTK